MSELSALSYVLDGGIARITLCRPDVLNALSPAVGEELSAALDRARDEGARVVLLAGEGRAFSAGGDLSGPLATTQQEVALALSALQEPIRKIANMPVPVVAAVQGAVAGGGVALALSCDFVIATRSAYFMLAFVHVGLAPEMGSAWLVANSVGRARALELALLGEKLSAEKALDWGLIARVVEDDALAPEAEAIVRRLLAGPPLSLAAIRRLIAGAVNGSLEDVFAMEQREAPPLVVSQDFREGVAAFTERRPAKFEGK